MSKTVNDNYPKNTQNEISDEQLKAYALQNYKQAEARQSKFPTEIVSLPSEGKLYPENHPLRSGTIEMKYMTAREEDILTSQNLIRQGIVLDKLFQSMIVTPINYDDLVVGDKNAIMIAARILGYGKDYTVEIECPSCTRTSEHTIDLTKLDPKSVTLDSDSIMIDPNQFELTLPRSKRKVVYELLTQGVDNKIEKYLQALKKTAKKDSVDTELTTRLKKLILSVDGVTDQEYIDNFVENELLAIDSKFLREQIKQVAPDVNLKFNFECPHCGHESETQDFEITTQFFWPGA